jgi:predicted DNA-binding transcriptional regulator AlpA
MQTTASTEAVATLLNEVGAARVLCLSVRTLQAWRSKGTGPPFVRVGRAVRYRRSDIVDWIAANVVAPAHHQPPNSSARTST